MFFDSACHEVDIRKENLFLRPKKPTSCEAGYLVVPIQEPCLLLFRGQAYVGSGWGASSSSLGALAGVWPPDSKTRT